MKKLLVILIFFALLAGGGYVYSNHQLSSTGKGGVVYIEAGSGLDRVAQQLEAAGLIRSAKLFRYAAIWEGSQSSLKPGEYHFTPEQDAWTILEKLKKGERFFKKLTIPEGSSFAQIAQLIADAGIAKREEVDALFQDKALLAQFPYGASSLEGYLFPATYEYDSRTQLQDLIKTMLKSFDRNFDNELRAQAQRWGWSIPQVVTLASIIEKETGRAEERPVISSVFHNRMKSGMRLQSDPTVIYGLKYFDGDLRKADLQNPHAYNTYVHTGLPPGPIASPGLSSLKAALNPATTEYLFFVGKGDKSHQFSKTLAEHEAAVKQYQLGGVPDEPEPAPAPKAAKKAKKPSPKTVEPRYDRPMMKTSVPPR